MATNISNYVLNPNTVTELRQWGSNSLAGYTAGGQVQTGDTGQANWTTTSGVGSAGDWNRYNIFRFNDTLQATQPIFWRVSFGAINAADRPAIQVIVGVSSDGSGNISGTTTTFTVGSNNTFDSTARNHYISTGNNRVSVCYNPVTVSGRGAFGFHLERTKNTSGADTNDGIIVSWFGSDGSSDLRNCQYYNYTNNIWSAVNTIGVMPPNTGITSGAYSTNVGIYPWHCFRNGTVLNPHRNAVCYFPTDLISLTPVTVYHYGANKTFLPLGNGASQGLTGGWRSNIALTHAMIWE